MIDQMLRRLSGAIFVAGLVLAGCGGAPCDRAVDNKLRYIEAEGSDTEKQMVKRVKDTPNAVAGLIEVCGKKAGADNEFAMRISCEADAKNLAEFKKCVMAPRL